MPASYEITEWVSPTGDVLNLMDIPNVGIQPGRQGAFMPPVVRSEDVIPYQHGARVRYLSFGPRDIDLPLYISADTESLLRTKLRQILSIFNPLDGEGKLRVTRPDGTKREINCRYHQGMQLVEDERSFGSVFAKCIVTFRCSDPLWYDATPLSNSFSGGTTVAFFPITPIHLNSSGIFAVPAPIINAGDLETWPVWVIQGPGSGIVLRNSGTGELIDLTGISLLVGESITIDTREGKRTVLKGDGTNLYGSMLPGSSLWPIYKGSNSIQVDMTGTTAASRVTLTYYQRYLSV